MRRVLFLMSEKTGSTFLISLLAGRSGRWKEWSKDSTMYDLSLATNPPGQCRFFLQGYTGNHIIDDQVRGRPVVDAPEAYTWGPPGILDPSFYDSLPGNDWKFVYLLRDPRNRTESLLARASSDGFRRDLAFKAQMAASSFELESISKIRHDARFRLVRFEELISNPVGVVAEIFEFIGFKPDMDVIESVAKEQERQWKGSSFSGGDPNARWHSWSKGEVAQAREALGNGLIAFGYEKSLDWEIPEKTITLLKEEPVLEPEPVPEPEPEAELEAELDFSAFFKDETPVDLTLMSAVITEEEQVAADPLPEPIDDPDFASGFVVPAPPVEEKPAEKKPARKPRRTRKSTKK